MKFAQVFNELLGAKGLTPYRMSRETGIPDRMIGYWRDGARTPSAENLIKIADYFNVSINYLLKGEEYGLNMMEDKKMNKRYVEFSEVKEGLAAYFKDRFVTNREGLAGESSIIVNQEKIGRLSKKMNIPIARIDAFIHLAFKINFESEAHEADFPTKNEFNKMMFFDECDDEAAINLQKRLSKENEILEYERQVVSAEGFPSLEANSRENYV